MAFYADEEEVWKCPKHPSKRRKSGICPTCLRERLNALCPDCATVRPCSCCPSGATSSSSSSSSSFSFFSYSGSVRESAGGVGSVGRVSNLIDSEPSFRRSRSVAIPFFRSRFAASRNSSDPFPPLPTQSNRSSFWSVFKMQKTKKNEEAREEEDTKRSEIEPEDKAMMMRSRSVSVPVASSAGAGGLRSSWRKSRGWHFPSPMKAFRHSKTAKVVQERSPLPRG
ncbi:hypothetical protein NMG60_11027550 [Bertholletia excelsa]